MKQRITKDDILQLSSEQQEKLHAWWQPEIGDTFIIEGDEGTHSVDKSWLLIINDKNLSKFIPLLSIGQMIQILTEMYDLELTIEQPKRMYWVIKLSNRVSFDISWHDEKGEEIFNKWFTDKEDELCNCLFQAVKEIL